MPMSEEVKTRLREAAKAKRLRHPLLKDVRPATLAVMCDPFKEDGSWNYLEPGARLRWCFAKTMSVEQIEALKMSLPHMIWRRNVYRAGMRDTVVFPYESIRDLLISLGVDHRKYLRWRRKCAPWQQGELI